MASPQAAVPIADGGDVGAAGYEAALDGLEALRAVLRDEHSLLTQYKMIVWGRVFTPVQARSPACMLSTATRNSCRSTAVAQRHHSGGGDMWCLALDYSDPCMRSRLCVQFVRRRQLQQPLHTRGQPTCLQS